MGAKRSSLPDEFPKGLTKRGNYYYYVVTAGHRKWINLGISLSAAIIKSKELYQKQKEGKIKPGTAITAVKKPSPNHLKRIRQALIDKEKLGRFDLISDAMIKKLFKSTVGNANKKGLRHNLSEDDIRQMLIESGGRCQVSGILFSGTRYQNTSRRPWMPSIDRINNSGGYSKKNCRVVCFAVNLALNDWGIEVLKTISVAIAGTNNCGTSHNSTARNPYGCAE